MSYAGVAKTVAVYGAKASRLGAKIAKTLPGIGDIVDDAQKLKAAADAIVNWAIPPGALPWDPDDAAGTAPPAGQGAAGAAAAIAAAPSGGGPAAGAASLTAIFDKLQEIEELDGHIHARTSWIFPYAYYESLPLTAGGVATFESEYENAFGVPYVQADTPYFYQVDPSGDVVTVMKNIEYAKRQKDALTAIYTAAVEARDKAELARLAAELVKALVLGLAPALAHYTLDAAGVSEYEADLLSGQAIGAGPIVEYKVADGQYLPAINPALFTGQSPSGDYVYNLFELVIDILNNAAIRPGYIP